MGKTKDLGHLAHIVAYNSENHITVPAGITMHTNQLVASQAYVTTALSSYALSSSLSSYVPTSRTITINGTTLDLSANRTFTIAAGLSSFNTRTGDVTLTSSDVTTALGFTPVTNARTITINGTTFDLSADRSYTVSAGTTLNGTGFVKASGTTITYDNSTYLTGITSTLVTNALGFTPYNSTNPAGYITSAGSITGNAATSTTFSTGRTNYKGVTDGAVAGQLMWKQYGNSHTIFDASNGTSPDGTTISRHTPQNPVATSDGGNAWGVNPNLMGWNGSSTFGIKVDWSRYSESTGSVAWTNVSGRPTAVSSFTNDSAYLTSVGIGNMTDVHRLFNNMGQNHGTYQDFNSVGNFGVRYMQGSNNGPQGGQHYGFTLGLGNDYTINQYASQFYWLRNTTNPYIWIRYQEGGSWGAWTKAAAGYADTAGSAPANGGNSSTVGGYSVSTGGDANTIPTRNASGYFIPQNWIQFNGNYGLYFPNHYGLHFYPNNDGSYGSAQILGEKNGWRGLHFGGGTGITLMMNEGEFGFHRQAVGWVARFTSGHFHGYANSAGSISGQANSATINATSGNAGNNIVLRDGNGDIAIGTLNTNHAYFGGGGRGLTSADSYGSYGNVHTYGTGQNGYSGYGAYDNAGYRSFFMWNSGNGGIYMQDRGKWELYYFGGNDCTGITGSETYDWVRACTNGKHRITNDSWCDATSWAYTFSNISDGRLKENIITVDSALDKVLQLRGVYYNWIIDTENKKHIGLIAQETAAVCPEVVNYHEETDTYSVNYSELSGLFVESTKELNQKLIDANARIELLETKLNQLLNA
jgi:hypothetical protein